MQKAKIIYLLSEEGRKNSILQGGDGKKVQVIETEGTPEVLELAIVNEVGGIFLGVGCLVNSDGQVQQSYNKPTQGYKLAEWDYRKPEIQEVGGSVCFDTVQTPEQLIKHEKGRIEKIRESKTEVEAEMIPAMERYEQKKREEEVKEAEEKAKREAVRVEREKRIALEQEELKQKEEAKKLAEIEYRKQREQWIKEDGSQYLKDCLAFEFNANREYVVERAEKEHPDYVVDYLDKAGWDRKASPSEEAIEELKRLKNAGLYADIVWLKQPPMITSSDYDDYELDEYEGEEAVVIRKYLGKYDLVRTDI